MIRPVMFLPQFSTISRLYHADIARGYSVFFCDIRLFPNGRFYRFDLLLREPRLPRSFTKGVTLFVAHIPVIISPRSNLKMLWINARRIITRMHYDHARRDRADEMFVRVSMGTDEFLPRQEKLTVTKLVCHSLPKPTMRRFLDATKKSISLANNWIFGCHSASANTLVASRTKLSRCSLLCFADQAFHSGSKLVSHINMLHPWKGYCNAPV